MLLTFVDVMNNSKKDTATILKIAKAMITSISVNPFEFI
jgi:hypothetical protein